MLLLSPKDPTIATRTSKQPLLFGDKFHGHEGDFHLDFAQDNYAFGFYYDKKTNLVCQAKFHEENFFKHFIFDQEANGLSDSIRADDEFMLLARKTVDDEIITLNQLAFTVAIAANYHGYTYDSRYCFPPTSKLPSACHALYWLIQFKSVESLPIGNCAYRGYKGAEPIMTAEATQKHYDMLEQYSHTPLINGLDLHDYCKIVTDNILDESKLILTNNVLALKSQSKDNLNNLE